MDIERECTCCKTHTKQRGGKFKPLEFLREMAIVFAWFILGAALLFIFEGLFERLFLLSEKGNGIKEVGSLVVIQNIPNSTLLTILSLLVVFAGVLSWVFKEIVRRDFDDKIRDARAVFNNDIALVKKDFCTEITRIDVLHKNEVAKDKELLEDERRATNASAKNSTAATLLYLYMYQNNNPPFNDNYREKIIGMALMYARMAVEHMELIKNKDIYNETEMLCLNNLCFALAMKASKSIKYDGYKADKTTARDSLKKLAEGEIFNQATRALVLWVFYEKEDERKEAADIIDKINDSSIETELRDVWNQVLGEKILPSEFLELEQKKQTDSATIKK